MRKTLNHRDGDRTHDTGLDSKNGTVMAMRGRAVVITVAILAGCSHGAEPVSGPEITEASAVNNAGATKMDGDSVEETLRKTNCGDRRQPWCDQLSKVVVEGGRLAAAYLDARYHPSNIEIAKAVCKALQEAFEVASNPWRGASVMLENWLLVYTKGGECITVSEFENIDDILEYRTDGQTGIVTIVRSNEVPFIGSIPSRIADIEQTGDCDKLSTWFEESALISGSETFSPLTRRAYGAYAEKAMERGKQAGCPVFSR